MNRDEKILLILSIIIILGPIVALAIWLDWSLGTTLSIMAIAFLLFFIRG